MTEDETVSKTPVPDDVAEALEACISAFEGHRYMSQDAKKYIEILRAASTPSASRVDNDMRIKVLKEMGFEYQCTRNEDGSLREHIITQESNRGFFINHTSLLCAMQRIPIALRVLAQATPSTEVQGLALEIGNVIYNGEQSGLDKRAKEWLWDNRTRILKALNKSSSGERDNV